MFKIQTATLSVLLLASACNTSRQENNASSIDSLNQTIIHPKHDDDRYVAWYDTRFAGTWMNGVYLDSLTEIFKRDTTRSIYEYTSRFNLCKDLLMIEIEGCVVDSIFYLKNEVCGNKYISKSTFPIDEKASFLLTDIYGNITHSFESPDYNKLIVDGVEFDQGDFRFQHLVGLLNGVYEVRDHSGKIIDTVVYEGGEFKDGDHLSKMALVLPSYIYDETRKPVLPHGDLVSVAFYTGDSSRVELVDDLGEGIGVFETAPNEDFADFEIIRHRTGFDLYERRSIRNSADPKLSFEFKRLAAK